MATIRMADPVYFNGTSLLSIAGLRITGTDPFRYQTRDVKNYALAYANRSATTSAFATEKPVNIRAVIAVSGRELLDQSLSNLKKILAPINKTLMLPISGEQRIYRETTLATMAISNVNGGYAELDMEFVTTEPYNYATTSTEIINVLNLTSGDKSYPIILDGTAKQAPIFTITVDSFTGSGESTISISNPLSNQTISIQRTVAAADVYIINCLERELTVNGAAVDYSGNFPEWESGNGFINYTDTFTSRQVDVNATYTKRYE